MRYMRLVSMVLLSFALLVMPTLASTAGWFDEDWEFRRPVTSNATLVEAPLNDFPALIEIDRNTLEGETQDDFADLRFADEQGNELAFEFDEPDPDDMDPLLAWVKVPDLSDADSETLYLYYGNPDATRDGALDSTVTWSSGFRSVHHLSETRNNASYSDSSPFGTDGDTRGSGNTRPEPRETGGVAGPYRYFPGELGNNKNQMGRIEVDDGALNITGNFTASAWADVSNPLPDGEDHHPILWKGSQIRGRFFSSGDYQFRIAVRSDRTMTWGVVCNSGFFGGSNEEWFDGGTAPSAWAHYAITFDGNAVRSYINGEQVGSDTACSGSSITANTDPMISGWAPTGTFFDDTVFRGGVDEIRFADEPRSQGWFATHVNNVRELTDFWQIGDQQQQGINVNRFRVTHPEQALTCSPPTVQVEACVDDACNYVNEIFEATLTPTNQTLSFAGESVSVPVPVRDAIDVQLAVTSDEVVPANPIECQNSAGEPTDCTISFSDSGFVFDVDAFEAGEPDATGTIQAVERADSSNECVPAFSSREADVTFTAEAQEPEPDALNRATEFTIEDQVFDVATGQSRTVSLMFDDTATASFALTYEEAGALALDALFIGEPDGPEEGLELEGATTLRFTPSSVCVFFDEPCDEASGDCPVTRSAGESTVNIEAQALGWGEGQCDDLPSGEALQNFRSDLSLEHRLSSPQNGDRATFTTSIEGIELTDNGVVSGAVSFQEVGIFELQVESFTYLGEPIDSDWSAFSPRIIPAYFEAQPELTGVLSASCDEGQNFLYSGDAQDWLMPPVMRLTARNSDDDPTNNYTQGSHFKASQESADIQWPDSDDSQAGTDGTPLPIQWQTQAPQIDSLSAGSFELTLDETDELTYERRPESRVDTFVPDFDIALENFVEDDGVALEAASQGRTFESDLEALEIVYGRGRIENIHGSEQVELPVEFAVDRFNGERFEVNDWDSCTPYAQEAFSLSEPIAQLSVQDARLLMGEPEDNRDIVVVPNNPPETGESRLIWGGSSPYLHHFEDDGERLTPPEALVTLGVYRGHDRIIHWREVR